MTDKPNGNGNDTVQLVLVPTAKDEQLWWNTQDGKDGGGTAYGNDMTCLPTTEYIQKIPIISCFCKLALHPAT